MPQKLSPQIISAAIAGFEQQKVQIDTQIAELRAMLSGDSVESSVAAPEATPSTRKKFSAAARKKMAVAQKARWAKIRGESEPPSPAPVLVAAPKAKRKLSAATKAALVANLKKARAAKAAKATTAPAPAATPKPKRKLSAAGRAAIIAATKKMWAAKRAAAKKV